MFLIKKVSGIEILDSRGFPTIETCVVLSSGAIGIASVPSGLSVGEHEAVELRDNYKDYHGKGVSKAINNVNSVISKFLYKEGFNNQYELDSKLIELDGSHDKHNLGANAILSVSLAFAKAVAAEQKIPLFKSLNKVFKGSSNLSMPIPMINIINGGKHANNNLDIQEFMIVPNSNLGIINNIKIASEIFHNLGKIISNKGLGTNLGDEGGFAPQISSTRQALDLICEAINISGYENYVHIAIDAASNTFCSEKDKILYFIDGKILDFEGIIKHYDDLISGYPIISIEDPIAENDIEGWKCITASLGKKISIVGDDIFVTNKSKLQYGINNNIANAVLIKPNQVGTLTETIETILMAAQNGYTTITSHRSGETEDNFISHLAVASGSKYIKAGSVSRGERVSKYNELIRINSVLSSNYTY